MWFLFGLPVKFRPSVRSSGTYFLRFKVFIRYFMLGSYAARLIIIQLHVIQTYRVRLRSRDPWYISPALLLLMGLAIY